MSVDSFLSTFSTEVASLFQNMEEKIQDANLLLHKSVCTTMDNFDLIQENAKKQKQKLFLRLNSIARLQRHTTDPSCSLTGGSKYHAMLCSGVETMLDIANMQVILCDKLRSMSATVTDLCLECLGCFSNPPSTSATNHLSLCHIHKTGSDSGALASEIRRLREYAAQLMELNQADNFNSRFNFDLAEDHSSGKPSDTLSTLAYIAIEVESCSSDLQASTRVLSQLLNNLDMNLAMLFGILTFNRKHQARSNELSSVITRIHAKLSALRQNTRNLSVNHIKTQIQSVIDTDLNKIDKLVKDICRESNNF